jgi:hypothetical protein
MASHRMKERYGTGTNVGTWTAAVGRTCICRKAPFTCGPCTLATVVRKDLWLGPLGFLKFLQKSNTQKHN